MIFLSIVDSWELYMKKKFLDGCMNLIKQNNQYDDIKLAEIKYGLEGLYLTITKLVVIFALAIIFKIVKEVTIFLLIYNVVRMPSFGLHATKSWICLLSSGLIFILTPLICNYLYIPIWFKAIIGIILILLFYKNAPADTKKKPIVSPKRRAVYKFLSVITVIIFTYCSIFINNQFIANCFVIAPIVQSFMISPLVYKIFNLPYDNYKEYLKNVA